MQKKEVITVFPRKFGYIYNVLTYNYTLFIFYIYIYILIYTYIFTLCYPGHGNFLVIQVLSSWNLFINAVTSKHKMSNSILTWFHTFKNFYLFAYFYVYECYACIYICAQYIQLAPKEVRIGLEIRLNWNDRWLWAWCSSYELNLATQ